MANEEIPESRQSSGEVRVEDQLSGQYLLGYRDLERPEPKFSDFMATSG